MPAHKPTHYRNTLAAKANWRRDLACLNDLSMASQRQVARQPGSECRSILSLALSVIGTSTTTQPGFPQTPPVVCFSS